MGKFTYYLGKVPGGLMVIPLLLGALLNTIDQQYFLSVQRAMHALGAKPDPAMVSRDWNEQEYAQRREFWEKRIRTSLQQQADLAFKEQEKTRARNSDALSEPKTREEFRALTAEKFETVLHEHIAGKSGEKGEEIFRVKVYRFLNLGTFSSALAKPAILPLIAVFLFCVGTQMNFRVGRRSLKKGLVITGAKLGAAILVGGLFIMGSTDGYGLEGCFLGLSAMAVIAAMENGNGGMYAALTGQYGNRSDVGALSVISLNDGPFFTLMALGIMGQAFPLAAFLAVLMPMLIGFGLAQLDPKVREFCAPGERLTIPFFAFALGSAMNLGNFFNPEVLAAGLFLAALTIFVTGGAAIGALKLVREKSPLAGLCEASTAGNATQTPVAVAAAMATSASMGLVTPDLAEKYANTVPTAVAQITISTITTAVVLPFLVIAFDRFLRKRGVDPRVEA